MAKAMRLRLQLGYWGAAPLDGFVEIAKEAERLGGDTPVTTLLVMTRDRARLRRMAELVLS